MQNKVNMLEYSNKIDLNARSKDGGTAVMTACINGHKYVANSKFEKQVHWANPQKLVQKF